MSAITINFLGNYLLCLCSVFMAKSLIYPKSKMRYKFSIKDLLTIFVVAILETITCILLKGAPKTICSFILIFALLKAVFMLSYWKVSLLTFIYAINLILCDILYLTVSIYICKITGNYFAQNIAFSILTNFIISANFVINVFIFGRIFRLLYGIKLNRDKLMTIIMMVCFICIILAFYLGFGDYKFDYNTIISIIMIVIFTAIYINLLNIKHHKELLESKYDSVLGIMNTYEEQIENQRIIHHENKNQLISIRSLLEENSSNEKVINYINSLLDDEKSVKNGEYTKFRYLPSGIKGLLYYKVINAKEKGINIKTNISKDLKDSILFRLSIEDLKQLGRLLGVYIDNAIEASMTSNEKEVGIEILKEPNDVIIIISNTYSELIENKSGNSTKGKGHGYGLVLAKRILKGHALFEEEREITDKVYIQKLIIKE